MRLLVTAAALAALCFPALAADNRGPKGTTSTSMIDRGMMDVLYSRQDGVSNSDTTFFGDPNAAAVSRAWRLHRSRTLYLDVKADFASNAAIYNSTFGTGHVFQISGSNVMAFLPRAIDTVTTNIGEFTNGMAASRVLAPLSGSASNTVTFSPVDANRCGGAGGSSCTMTWVFRSATVSSNNEGRAVVQLFWNGLGAADLRGSSNMVTAQTDTNSVNVRARTRAEIAVDGSTPRLFTNVNRAWEVNQTKASRSVFALLLQGVTQWTWNSTGDMVDGVGGNLVDTVDVSAHDHSGGGLDGSNLGSNAVAAAQIQDTVCTGILSTAFGNAQNLVVEYTAVAFQSVGPSVTEADVQFWKTPTGAVVFNAIRVYTITAPDLGAGTQSYTITLRDDAADTALSCTISETSRDCTDTDTVAPATGSLMTLGITPSGTPAVSSNVIVTICTGA